MKAVRTLLFVVQTSKDVGMPERYGGFAVEQVNPLLLCCVLRPSTLIRFELEGVGTLYLPFDGPCYLQIELGMR